MSPVFGAAKEEGYLTNNMNKTSVVVEFKSYAGSWTEHTFPIWITEEGIKNVRYDFQAHQQDKKSKLGYCARTEADSWLQKHYPQWIEKLTNDFDRLMLAYAMCMAPGAIKFWCRHW
jgi:hypothetical protein